MPTFQPPPTYAPLELRDDKTGQTTFNPIWLDWFISLSAGLGSGGAVSSVTATAPLASSGGTTPNITIGVILAANFPALTGDITTAAGSLATTLKNTGTAGTYTKTTFDAQGRETSGTSAVLASADFANQGTTTTVLHGNAAGNPSFGAVTINDVSGSTGTGNFVFASTPTLTTPVIGAATGTSLNVTGTLTGQTSVVGPLISGSVVDSSSGSLVLKGAGTTSVTITGANAVFSGTIKPAASGYLSSDGTVGLTQASTATLGKSITLKDGLVVAFA